MIVLMSNSPRLGNQPTWVSSVPRRLRTVQPPITENPMMTTTRNATGAASRLAHLTTEPSPCRFRETIGATKVAASTPAITVSAIFQPIPRSASVIWRTKSQASNASVPMISTVTRNVVSAAAANMPRAARSRRRRRRLVWSTIAGVAGVTVAKGSSQARVEA